MDRLRELQKNWEGLARTDPLWAICTDPLKKNNGWSREEFFATGRDEIARVVSCVESLGQKLDWSAPALDFGCGVGRLTRAMAEHFRKCWGVDISPTMVRMAEEFNADRPQCHFLLNEGDQLAGLPENHFGFIYTSIVLQHIPETITRKYLQEMVRVLKPGGVLVFQIPAALRGSALARLRHKLALRSRLRKLLRKQDGYVMEMHCMAEDDVRAVIAACGARVVDARLTNSCDPSFNGKLRYLDREPEQGFVSTQYCVTKG